MLYVVIGIIVVVVSLCIMALHYTPGDVQVLAVNAERIIRRSSSHYRRNSSEGGSEDSDYQSYVFSSQLSIHPRHQTLIRK